MSFDHPLARNLRIRRRADPRRPPARRGLTLIEVLISMFVLTVGLLGVAALLPLGQKKMLESAIDQQKSHVADAAFGFLRSEGALDPSRWVWVNSTYGTGYYAAIKPGTAARLVCPVVASPAPTTTQFATTASGLSTQNGYYNNCLVEFRQGKLQGQRGTVTSYTYSGSVGTFAFTTPFSAAPYSGDTLTTDLLGNGRFVPGDAYNDLNNNGTYDPADTFVVLRARPFAMDPLLVANLGTAAGDFATGMPRLTLSAAGSTTPVPMGTPAAELLCLSDDDLDYLYPPDGITDPTQIYYGIQNTIPDANGSTAWCSTLRRENKGNFSWVATFVPSISGNTELYNVSVAVFYKRVLAAAGQDGGPVGFQLVFSSSGYGGGASTLLAATTSATPQADLAQVKSGSWLLVSSTDNTDYRWYRVMTTSASYQDSANANRWTENVTLSGSDWNTAGATTSAAVNVAFYPGVVGVFDRTLKLSSLPDSSN